MLSTKQKKLRDSAQALVKVSASETASGLGISIRLFDPKFDSSRVIELWANLAMIQEMEGRSVWLEEAQAAKLEWKEFISKLIKAKTNRVFVFENPNGIFGFAFANLEMLTLEGKKHLKAILKELYLEPNFRSKEVNPSMATMLKEALKHSGVEFIEFAIKDLA